MRRSVGPVPAVVAPRRLRLLACILQACAARAGVPEPSLPPLVTWLGETDHPVGVQRADLRKAWDAAARHAGRQRASVYLWSLDNDQWGDSVSFVYEPYRTEYCAVALPTMGVWATPVAPPWHSQRVAAKARFLDEAEARACAVEFVGARLGVPRERLLGGDSSYVQDLSSRCMFTWRRTQDGVVMPGYLKVLVSLVDGSVVWYAHRTVAVSCGLQPKVSQADAITRVWRALHARSGGRLRLDAHFAVAQLAVEAGVDEVPDVGRSRQRLVWEVRWEGRGGSPSATGGRADALTGEVDDLWDVPTKTGADRRWFGPQFVGWGAVGGEEGRWPDAGSPRAQALLRGALRSDRLPTAASPTRRHAVQGMTCDVLEPEWLEGRCELNVWTGKPGSWIGARVPAGTSSRMPDDGQQQYLDRLLHKLFDPQPGLLLPPLDLSGLVIERARCPWEAIIEPFDSQHLRRVDDGTGDRGSTFGLSWEGWSFRCWSSPPPDGGTYCFARR